MALLLMDGFDTGDYAQRWGTAVENSGLLPTYTLVAGRFGSGQALSIKSTGSSQSGGIIRGYAPASNTVRIGAAVNITGVTASNFPLLIIPAFGGSYGNLSIQVVTGGSLIAVLHSTSYGPFTTISSSTIASASAGLPINQWVYLEVEYLPETAPNGRIILRKNGVVILDFTGTTRSSTSITKPDSVILCGGYSNGPAVYWDDVYVADTTGAQNNTFLGDVEVRALAPNGNGTYSQFVGSDGDSVNNYAIINNTTYTDYVESSTVGQKDSYQLPDLSGVNVKAVQSVVRGAQASGGMAAVRPFVRIGGADYPGVTQNLGQQTVSTNIFEINPATSAAWTQTDVNSAEVGVEVV